MKTVYDFISTIKKALTFLKGLIKLFERYATLTCLKELEVKQLNVEDLPELA